MYANDTISSLPDHSENPLEGEDVLTSMLQWGKNDSGAQDALAGLVMLNWTAAGGPGQVYDKVVSGQQKPLFSLSVGQLTEIFGVLADEGTWPKVIYFTGEDPAGHPQLGEFLELARQTGIEQVGLQCNGLRIANDDQLLDTLARLQPMLFVEFDGFDETTSLILHGRRDLPFETKRGLDRLAATGLQAALLTSVAQGVNLQEVGAIATFGLKHPAVFSAIFRPIPPRQSRLAASSALHVSATGIMEALEKQSRGLFQQAAFAPALCCRPERHFYSQVPYTCLQSAATSTSSAPPEGTALAPRPVRNGSVAPPSVESCFWLGVHEFMTPWNNNLHQAQQCPLVIMTPEGRTIPYCLYNATL